MIMQRWGGVQAMEGRSGRWRSVEPDRTRKQLSQRTLSQKIVDRVLCSPLPDGSGSALLQLGLIAGGIRRDQRGLSADRESVCTVPTVRTDSPDGRARPPPRRTASLDDMAVVKQLRLARSRVLGAVRTLARSPHDENVVAQMTDDESTETEGRPCEACRTSKRQRAHIHLPCGRRIWLCCPCARRYGKMLTGRLNEFESARETSPAARHTDRRGADTAAKVVRKEPHGFKERAPARVAQMSAPANGAIEPTVRPICLDSSEVLDACVLAAGAKVEGSSADPLQRQYAPIRHDVHQAKPLVSTKSFGEHLQANHERSGLKPSPQDSPTTRTPQTSMHSQRAKQTSRQGDTVSSKTVILETPSQPHTDEKGLRGNQLHASKCVSAQSGRRPRDETRDTVRRHRPGTPESLLFGVVAAALSTGTAEPVSATALVGTTAPVGDENTVEVSEPFFARRSSSAESSVGVDSRWVGKGMWTSLHLSASSPTSAHFPTSTHMQGAHEMQHAQRSRQRHGVDSPKSLPALRAARTCVEPCDDPLLAEPVTENRQPEAVQPRTKKCHTSKNERLPASPSGNTNGKPPRRTGSLSSMLRGSMPSCSLVIGTPPRRMPHESHADASALRASLGLSASVEVDRCKSRTARGMKTRDPLLRSSTSLGFTRLPSDLSS